jgi:hypothetical protein
VRHCDEQLAGVVADRRRWRCAVIERAGGGPPAAGGQRRPDGRWSQGRGTRARPCGGGSSPARYTVPIRRRRVAQDPVVETVVDHLDILAHRLSSITRSERLVRIAAIHSGQCQAAAACTTVVALASIRRGRTRPRLAVEDRLCARALRIPPSEPSKVRVREDSARWLTQAEPRAPETSDAPK